MRLTVPHEGEEGRTAYPYPYLIALRFCHGEWILGATAAKIRERFGIIPGRESMLLPHITLFGPFHLRQGRSDGDLYHVIQGAVGRRSWLSFQINGWERKRGDHGAIIAAKILPSADLVTFREDLASALEEMTICSPGGNRGYEDFWYHSTVALNVDESTCRRMWEALISDSTTRAIVKDEGDITPTLLRSLHLPLESIRITVLWYNRIRAEIDLATGKVLTRNQSLTPWVWQESLQRYRRLRGMELPPSKSYRTAEIFVLADTHFGHANIIRYCARPFHPLRVEEMDDTLIRNWNSAVGKMARVYFLGDLCYGALAANPAEYLHGLEGKITVIRGNHDHALPSTLDRMVITKEGIRFLLVHDPDPWVGAFDGWVIHGHHHNNDLVTYPFINFQRRTVNVSVEVTGYAPISLREIVTLIKTADSDKEPVLIRSLPCSESSLPVELQSSLDTKNI